MRRPGAIEIRCRGLPDGGQITSRPNESHHVEARHRWFDARLSEHGHGVQSRNDPDTVRPSRPDAPASNQARAASIRNTAIAQRRAGAMAGSGRRGGMPGARHGAMALPSMRRLPIRCQAVPDTTAGPWRMGRDGWMLTERRAARHARIATQMSPLATARCRAPQAGSSQTACVSVASPAFSRRSPARRLRRTCCRTRATAAP